MLYLDAPIGPIRGLMIYRDHADKSLFYYVPERPRLALNDGIPEFVFLKYRRDITDNAAFDEETKQSLGGGFLAFTVDLGVTDEQLEEIKGDLSRFSEGGEVKLTPIAFRKGSVRLSITKDTADAEGAPADQPRGVSFFEDIFGTTTPSLFGFNRATFGVILSQEGATLIEAGLKSGISPIGVLYELEFLGLRPAFNVRISANYHRVYKELDLQFGARGTVQAVSIGVDIGAAFQRLRDQGIIKVEVVNFTDDADLRRQADDAFNWFKGQLMQDFFRSSMPAPALTQQSNNGGLLGQLTNLLGALTTTQTGPATPQRGQPATGAPNADPPPAEPSSNMTSTSDANTALAGAGAGGGGAGGIAPFQIAFSLKYIDQVEDKERIFEYSMQAAEKRTAAPQGMFSTIVQGLDLRKAIIEVSLDDEFFKRLVSTVSVGGDLAKAGVSTLAVNLEYPGTLKPNQQPEHVDGFIFKPDQLDPQTFTTWLNAKKDRSYRYQMDIHFSPDSPFLGKEAHITTDWLVTRDRQLTLDPLDYVALHDIEITLGKINADQISQVQVEMMYKDPTNGFEPQRTFMLKPTDSGVHWRLRLSNPELLAYHYRLTYFMADGTRYITDWASSEDPGLVINDPFQGMLNIRLTPLLDPNQIVEAVVNLNYQEAETGFNRSVQKVFSGGPLTSQVVTIPTLSAAPAGFTYDVTVIRADGSVFESGEIRVENSKAALPIVDGIGRAARIRAHLSSQDLASAQLSAVKVLVVGTGEAPDMEEALFTPSQANDQFLTLVQQSEGPIAYRYNILGYSRTGIPIPGDSGQETTPNLIVRLPTPAPV
jgi:hypothetical protein